MKAVILRRLVLHAVRVLVCITLPLAAAQAQEGDSYTYPTQPADPETPLFTGPLSPDLLPDTEVFRFETRDKFYDKRKYSNDFRMKGIEISPNVYFGEAKIAGEKGPGIVVEQGDWFWGFNHQGAEILLKF